jgi:GTP-binding protein
MPELVINTAEFMTSATSRQGWPPLGPQEVAFAGRSNVGKSSLINRLVNRKKLVRTSARPGCTQQINFFSFNQDRFRFVDLPGYGFARAPLALKSSWGPMIESYLLQRPTLAMVVAVFDIRRDLSRADFDLLAWLRAHAINSTPVFTKADKLARAQLQLRMSCLRSQLKAFGGSPLIFSAESGQGREALWAALRPALRLEEDIN